ncbi:hypothetical protein ACSBR1_025423 [Camellia fascicularis]
MPRVFEGKRICGTSALRLFMDESGVVWKLTFSADRTGKIALIRWFIWKARNNLVFNHMPVNPSEVIQKCSQAWFEHNRHCNGSSTRSPEGPSLHPPSHRWRSATHGGIKINCDASFNQKHLKASAAAIMPDRRGRLLDGLVSSFSASSALLAEAQAIHLACFLAQEHNTSLVEIESDNQSLIKLCVSEDVPLGSVWQWCLTFEASQSCNNGSLVGPVEQTTGQRIGLLVPMLAKSFLLIGWITHLWPLFLFCLVMLPVRCFVL